jgi:hypothetical protein
MSRHAKPIRFVLVVAVLGTLLAVYLAAIHPWMCHYGSTPAERRMPLPGDDLVPNPAYVTTRAITIRVPPDRVWPWLAQIGQGRAGFYSYSWLENLAGADIHNAHRIHPEWQDLEPGSFVRSVSKNWLGGAFADETGWTVVSAEPGRFVVLKDWGVFYLQPFGEGRTRLIFRGREARVGLPALATRVFLLDPIYFIMEKRMVREIRRLAEGRRHWPGLRALSHVLGGAGFIVAAVVCGVLVACRKRKWPWLVLPLGYFLLVLFSTSDIQSALVAFVALGLVVAGTIVFRRRWWLFLLALWIYSFSVLLFTSNAFPVFGALFLVEAAAIMSFSLRRGRPIEDLGCYPD